MMLIIGYATLMTQALSNMNEDGEFTYYNSPPLEFKVIGHHLMKGYVRSYFGMGNPTIAVDRGSIHVLVLEGKDEDIFKLHRFECSCGYQLEMTMTEYGAALYWKHKDYFNASSQKWKMDQYEYPELYGNCHAKKTFPEFFKK